MIRRGDFLRGIQAPKNEKICDMIFLRSNLRLHPRQPLGTPTVVAVVIRIIIIIVVAVVISIIIVVVVVATAFPYLNVMIFVLFSPSLNCRDLPLP